VGKKRVKKKKPAPSAKTDEEKNVRWGKRKDGVNKIISREGKEVLYQNPQKKRLKKKIA